MEYARKTEGAHAGRKREREREERKGKREGGYRVCSLCARVYVCMRVYACVFMCRARHDLQVAHTHICI